MPVPFGAFVFFLLEGVEQSLNAVKKQMNT